MSSRAEAFEHWIRTSFVEMNTELENLYFAQAGSGASDRLWRSDQGVAAR